MLEVTAKVWESYSKFWRKKEKLQWEGLAEKEGFKSVMKERVDDGACAQKLL